MSSKKEAERNLELLGQGLKKYNQHMEKANEALRSDDLDTALEEMVKVRDHQIELLNQLPTVREFLDSKGLDHYSQLDEQGRRELEAFLKAVLEAVSR